MQRRGEKAAKEAAEAEKKAKMEREAEDARWRAQLASMASSALLTQSLEKELADDSEVRKKLSAGKEAVESLEREILEVEASSVAGREAKAREIGALKEQLASLVEMRSVVADFDLLMGGLVNGAKDAHEELEQQGADALGVAARMERELDAAKQRLRSADEHKVGLEKQLEKAKADAAPQEAQAASELMRLTDAAVAAKLAAQIGARRSNMLVVEEQQLLDSDGEVKRAEAKKARAAEAFVEVETLTNQVSVDEKEEERLEGEEQRVEALLSRMAARASEAAAEREGAIERAKGAAEALGGFVQSATAKLAGLDAKARPLVATSIFAIAEKREKAVAEVKALESEHARLNTAAANAEEGRKGELRVLAAEKQAVVSARAEHERFLAQKQKQYEGLDREAIMASQPIEGRDACLTMVQNELEAARREAERLESAATSAEAARRTGGRARSAQGEGQEPRERAPRSGRVGGVHRARAAALRRLALAACRGRVGAEGHRRRGGRACASRSSLLAAARPQARSLPTSTRPRRRRTTSLRPRRRLWSRSRRARRAMWPRFASKSRRPERRWSNSPSTRAASRSCSIKGWSALTRPRLQCRS